MNSVEIVERIEAELKSQGKTKTEFYNACGITPATLTYWRKGKNNPSMDNLKKINEYLNLNFTVTEESEPADADIKAAFFGGDMDLTEEERDEIWEDARAYARFKAEQRKKK